MDSEKRIRVLGSDGGRSPLAILGPLAVLAAWGVLSSSGLVSALVLPSPLRVVLSARDIGPNLLFHAAATLGRILTGFAAGVLLGVFFGTLMQYWRTAYVLLDGI